MINLIINNYILKNTNYLFVHNNYKIIVFLKIEICGLISILQPSVLMKISAKKKNVLMKIFIPLYYIGKLRKTKHFTTSCYNYNVAKYNW